jgi:aquaporin Z
MLRKAIVEAIGTFFLMLTIGQVVLDPGAGAFAPLAIGATLLAMVFAGGHVSGAHYNPAVSLGIFLRGRSTASDMITYWVAQIVGATLATFVTRFLKGGVSVEAISSPLGTAFFAEFLFTFALIYVVLNVATARGNDGNSHYGLSIGFTVMAGAYCVGAISGAAFNPAVAIGLALLGIAAPANLWLYFSAHFLAGAAAAMLFKVLDLGADKPTATPTQQGDLKSPGEPSQS